MKKRVLAIVFLAMGSGVGLLGFRKSWRSGVPEESPDKRKTACGRVEAPGNRPASPGPAEQDSEPQDRNGPTAPPMPTLRERLESFRMLLREDLQTGKLPPSDRVNLWRRIDAVWLDLHVAVFADPETYCRFLLLPENDPICEGLLGILSRAHLAPPASQLLTVGMIPLPQRVLEGFQGMLVSGTDAQKLAVLRMAEGTLHLDFNSCKPLVEQSKELLTHGDPRIQAAALGVLAAKGRDSLDPCFDAVQRLAGTSEDADLQLHCLAAAARMGRPEAEAFLTNGIRKLVEGKAVPTEPPVLEELIRIVEVKLAALDGERAGRYADLIEIGLRCAPDPMIYRHWTAVSLALPAARLAPVLEEVGFRAPSQSIRDAAQRVLAQLHSGESRVATLKKTFEEK